MARKLNRRGFTLIEIMVASVLALILFGLLILTVMPLMRQSIRGYERIVLSQTALVASSRLATDLQTTTLAGMVLPPPDATPPGLVLGDSSRRSKATGKVKQFVSLQPIDWVSDQGAKLWIQELVLYQWDPTQQSITRARWKPPTAGPSDLTLSADGPTLPSATQIPILLSGSTLQRLAHGVVAFRFALEPDGSLPLTLEMRLEQLVPGRAEPESFSMSRKFYMRNKS